MNDFKKIREGTIASLDHIFGLDNMRAILEMQLEDSLTRGYYATGECFNNTCGYPRIWFGKCMAQYRDHVAAKHLKELFT